MEIYTLKIKKGAAGKRFPFDRIYLVKYEDREYIEKLFRFSLVMPIEGTLLELLTEQQPEEFLEHPVHRDDEAQEAAPYDGDWKKFLKKGWILVVPILTKWANQAMPKYLTNEKWYNSKEGRKRLEKQGATLFPNMTYLQTPVKKIRPVCVACPRFIEHQNGDCHLGQSVCYESLPMGLQNYFEAGLKTPEPSENVKEPKVPNVDVQEDHA